MTLSVVARSLDGRDLPVGPSDASASLDHPGGTELRVPGAFEMDES